MSGRKWKKVVLLRDGYECRICRSKKDLTIHHKKAKVNGGKTIPENCVTWCENCHRLYHKRWGNTVSDDYGNPINLNIKKKR